MIGWKEEAKNQEDYNKENDIILKRTLESKRLMFVEAWSKSGTIFLEKGPEMCFIYAETKLCWIGNLCQNPYDKHVYFPKGTTKPLRNEEIDEQSTKVFKNRTHKWKYSKRVLN